MNTKNQTEWEKSKSNMFPSQAWQSTKTENSTGKRKYHGQGPNSWRVRAAQAHSQPSDVQPATPNMNTQQTDHTVQTDKNNALMLKMDREREARRQEQITNSLHNGALGYAHTATPAQAHSQPDNWEDLTEAQQDAWMLEHASKKAQAHSPLGGTCSTCGKVNEIVNQCRCDQNNLPTRCEDTDAANLSLLAFAAVVRGHPDTPESLKTIASKELLDHTRGAYLVNELRTLRNELDQVKAHAQRLADAASQAIEQVRQAHGKLTSDNQHLGTAQRLLREAIAQWEGDKQ